LCKSVHEVDRKLLSLLSKYKMFEEEVIKIEEQTAALMPFDPSSSPPPPAPSLPTSPSKKGKKIPKESPSPESSPSPSPPSSSSTTPTSSSSASSSATPAPVPSSKDLGAAVFVPNGPALLKSVPSEAFLARVPPSFAEFRDLCGPGHDTEELLTLEDIAAARSVSTFPLAPDGSKPLNSPVCDKFRVEIGDCRTIAAIANGYNYGERPRDAASAAVDGFVWHMSSRLAGIVDAASCAKESLQALCTAHNFVVHARGSVWDAGTSALLGAVMFPLSDTKDDMKEPKQIVAPGSKFGIVLTSLGDSKAFLVSGKDGSVQELTHVIPGIWKNRSEPGGRVGPVAEKGLPDFGNTGVVYSECEAGDVLVLCTTGLADDFDPEELGIEPGALIPELEGESWASLGAGDERLLEVVKATFAERRMERLLADTVKSGQKVDKEGEGEEVKRIAEPEEIARTLTQYALRVTKKRREFIHENPAESSPKDKLTYPGRCDHCTCLAIKAAFPKEMLVPAPKEFVSFVKSLLSGK